MNNRTNQRQVGRLTGRVEVDAGLLRYRDLLSRENHVVADNRSHRAARVATAVLLLVLAFSVVGAAAECAGAGPLYLTPGTSSGGSTVHTAWRAPEVLLTDGGGAVAAMSEGTFEFVAVGKFNLEEPARYAGELVVGPYEFTP